MAAEVWVVRHGATAWSVSGRHTGRTDVPLDATGELQAARIGERLRGKTFELVLTSPLSRAADTCRAAGFSSQAETDADLEEWDYGDYEGLTTAEIRRETPGWSLFHDGAPGGEDASVVGARADRVIARLDGVEGPALLFAHGHVLRVLASRWIGLPAEDAGLLALFTGSVSVLGYERETKVIVLWNDVSHLG